MNPNYGNWQKAFWRILSDPTIEVVATLAVMLVATWFVLDNDVAHQGTFVLFGRR